MSLRKIEDYQKLFLDMDSFFASVEQQVQPGLRKKPVGIAPYTGDTGCIISSSKLAKRLGVKTGMSVGEARKVCPDIVVIESRPALYYLYHKEIVKILESFSPFLKVLSIDEMTILLGPTERNRKKAKQIALKIKRVLKERVGDFLTCSIGVGPNQFLAKLAGELGKPDGLVFVAKSELPQFYQKLDLLDLPGINERMKEILHCGGIKTPLAFYQASQAQLVQLLNHPGKAWYLRLRGFEVDDYKTKTVSIGHSFVLPPKYRSKDGVRKVVIKLACKIGCRLRRQKLLAKGLSLSVQFSDGLARRFINTAPFSDTHTLIRQALHLFNQIDFKTIPFGVYLVAFKLSKNQGYHSLFPQFQKMSQLSQVIDRINDKYGPETIYFAEIEGAEDVAPDRIPFGRPRYEIDGFR